MRLPVDVEMIAGGAAPQEKGVKLLRTRLLALMADSLLFERVGFFFSGNRICIDNVRNCVNWMGK